MRRPGLICFFFALLAVVVHPALRSSTVDAQTELDLPCVQRQTAVAIPTADVNLFCLEQMVQSDDADEMAFTALAALSDGRLFTVSPLEGTLIEIVDTDGDSLPDAFEIRADSLERPASLTADQDVLYITGGSAIYRWTHDEGIDTLVSALPTGSGYWNGGLTVGGEGENARLYVGIGAACDFCEEAVSDTQRGVILSFAIDGSERQLVATGFRQPTGLTWFQDSLWVTDTAPTHLDTGQYDELNRIVLDAEIGNYGAPYCAGFKAVPVEAQDCADTLTPVLTFPSGSVPIAITAYQGEAFAAYTGQFVIAFSGTAHASRMRGYTVEFVAFDGAAASQLTLVPALPDRDQQYGGVGFYPHHLYGAAISPEGWIYLSVGGGDIYVVRPA